ncbi:hypothetical protein CTEN210_08169 [Chaetoceros tenuissimus]|uniref:PDZ domain-containing protein n=1 Tax=Chaetoceros tenuissimus TaxID=426638 RepID=A0AAD3H6E0_9STRA|nr:hypothetical protein CTEN210_08169 [Chaetoceros tenuissimus]
MKNILLLVVSLPSLALSFVAISSSRLAFSTGISKNAPWLLRSKLVNEDAVIKTDSFITTKSSELDKNLTSDERSIVNLVRLRSPSVVSVSSYAIPTVNRRRQRNSLKKKEVPPVGSQGLGSGSAFFITDDGYLLTNYHVIERAYQMQQSSMKVEEFYQNVTQNLKNSTLLAPLQEKMQPPKPFREAQVYVQIASEKTNIPCRIVGVKPENDIAILKLNVTAFEESNPGSSLPQPIPDGDATELLQGQFVMAIGNPFGLSQTVTTGVVSSLDRTVKGVAGNDIKGCIQTDTAINPGNSGGPLLNSQGAVVGVNTMIISTSGSNAGIGFAVPVEGFWNAVMDTIDKDREEENMKIGGIRNRKKGWLGLKVVTDKSLESALFKKIKGSDGIFVMEVNENSPASEAGIVGIVKNMPGRVDAGDRIVAVNGNALDNALDLKCETKSRIVGEQITITVENTNGERRVTYVTLGEKP